MSVNVPKILSSNYATFRSDVQEYFEREIPKPPSVIYDPMAGTAPLIPFVETNGHKAYFNDLLPIHLYINKAKTYEIFECYKEFGHDWLFQQLLRCMAPLQSKRLCISSKWIDDSVLNGLIQAWRAVQEYNSNVAVFLKAIIILCVRPFSSITKSENPTWLKLGGMCSGDDLQAIVRESLSRFDKYFDYHYSSPYVHEKGECVFTAEDAARLPLPEKVDVILTSPPFCNRLDPIVQYGPENYFLAAVGHTIPDHSMVGTNKVRDYETFAVDLEILGNRSNYANFLLNRIKRSGKQDDVTYYVKYYTRYFMMVYKCLKEALRNLSPSGKMHVALQDNAHRGQLIEIDRLLSDLLEADGWKSEVIRRWERHHLGLRNISRDHAFVRPKQIEKILVIWRQ